MGEIKMIFPPIKPETVKSIKVKIIVEMTNTITILNCKAEEMTIHLNWNPYTKEVTRCTSTRME